MNIQLRKGFNPHFRKEFPLFDKKKTVAKPNRCVSRRNGCTLKIGFHFLIHSKCVCVCDSRNQIFTTREQKPNKFFSCSFTTTVMHIHSLPAQSIQS